MAEKNNTPKNYINSAKNLCNPEEVKTLLEALHTKQNDLKELTALIPKDIADNIVNAGALIKEIDTKIRAAVDEYGSYQDLETSDYAVCYSRATKTYRVDKFKDIYPKYAPAVVVETINKKALEGLIKGKLISEEDLERTSITEEEITYAYYIR